MSVKFFRTYSQTPSSDPPVNFTMQTELKPNLGSDNMQTNPRLIIHQQYIYHPPYYTDYINIFNIIPVAQILMRDKIWVRYHDI